MGFAALCVPFLCSLQRHDHVCFISSSPAEAVYLTFEFLLRLCVSLQPSQSLCAEVGCSVRVSVDGHDRCSTHAPCCSHSGFDPTKCTVCWSWVVQVSEAPAESRPALPALQALRKAWTKASQAFVRRAGAPLALG